MTRLHLLYVHHFRDRHGKDRYYFRRNGKRTPLPGSPGSSAFMETYQAALNGQVEKPNIGANRTKPGTVNAAVVAYYNSSAFQMLAAETRRTRRNILERFRAEHGDKRVALIQRQHVERMLAAKANTPSAARNFLNTLRALIQHCIACSLRVDDPTAGIKRIKIKTDGYYVWSEDDVATFRATYALGTRARLALELLACTGQRRADIIRMGRQHVRDGTLAIRQQKTGTLVELPVLPELQAAIDAMPKSEHLTFLTVRAGEPFSPAGFTNHFRDLCRAAGIQRGSAHGLRKYAATRHANCGATAHELMAWFGWKTLSEAERYTRSADRRKLAAGMIERLGSRTSSGKPE